MGKEQIKDVLPVIVFSVFVAVFHVAVFHSAKAYYEYTVEHSKHH